MRLILRWWTHPVDYAWTTAYHRFNPMLRQVNVAVGCWCWLYAVLCVLTTHSPAGMPAGVARVSALILAATLTVLGALWIRGPWPTKNWSRAFVAFIEISAGGALLMLADPFVALPCATALGVNGSYIAAFHSTKMFVAHQAWAVTATGVLFLEAVMQPGADVALACAYLILLTLVLFSAPILTQALLLMLRGDAASAFYDPLTGLRNRRGLEAAILDCEQSDKAVSVMVVDLDNFKMVNDRYGHAHGDLVLRNVANAIHEFFVPPAVTARTGGEEFVVMVRGDVAEVTDRAHALRARCAGHDGAGATVSIGICHTDAKTLATVGFEQICDRADLAMYDAKSAGGNSVHVDVHV